VLPCGVSRTTPPGFQRLTLRSATGTPQGTDSLHR